MKTELVRVAVTFFVALAASPAHTAKSEETLKNYGSHGARSIRVENDTFVLDGKPFHFVSGSAHYFRIPHQLWEDRLKKLRAAGLKAVSTYVEWSFHEPEEGQYQWEGDRDLVEFVKLAQKADLLVLLRPGPYICAERDFGGFPYWLLTKYPDIKLRTVDRNYMNEVSRWYEKLFQLMKPLMYGNGGPIILVQVENEYGSYFEQDSEYMRQLRDLTKKHVGETALLYTTDGAGYSNLKYGSVANTVTTMDFGAGNDVIELGKILRSVYPKGPMMNSEYYPGWLTHWGENFARGDTRNVVKTLKEMLDVKMNVNFYVMHGGTNFEFTAGANFGSKYEPDITSYDYDAPISEAGDITDKFIAIRNLLAQYFPDTTTFPIPSNSTKAEYGGVDVSPYLRLLSPLGRKALGVPKPDVVGSVLPTFESSKQRGGMLLYETQLSYKSAGSGQLSIEDIRDYAYVYVDGHYCGHLSREFKTKHLKINFKQDSILSILVEHQGRINFGNKLKDFKGLLSPVKLKNTVLSSQWKIMGFPLENVSTEEKETVVPEARGPIMLKGKFVLPNGESPADTFLDTTGWRKGFIWINGHNLGRYWPGRRTQITLYVPGVYLKPAPQENLIQILEMEECPKNPSIKFIGHPIFN